MILFPPSSDGGGHFVESTPLRAETLLPILDNRLAAVASFCGKKNLSSVRQIHLLRVATRKAQAALDVCEPLLKRSQVRKLQASLKRQRGALGDVRDWDVLISHVLCTPTDDKAETRCDLLLYLAQERRRLWRKAKRKLRSAQQTFLLLASQKRKPRREARHAFLSSPFRRALRKPLAMLEEIESRESQDVRSELRRMHDLRIVCKKVRYLLELRAEIAPQEVGRSDLPFFVEAQQRLGELHDAAEQPEILRCAQRPRVKSVRRWLARAEAAAESRLAAEYARFTQWEAQRALPAEIRRLAKSLE